MISEKDREAIALKRFSLISPVLNGQITNQKLYFEEVCANPIDMPYYGMRSYSPRTLAGWYADYLRQGIDALKPCPRSDLGKSRRIDPTLCGSVQTIVQKFPRITKRLLYNELIKTGDIDPGSVSLSTFYRYLSAHPYLLESADSPQEKDEMKRFSHRYINELWQTDVMYGPYLKVGGKKRKTYLIAYIDDASRLITHASFSFDQNFETLRHTLKEAVLTRGIPKLLYTDNGSIYRSSQLSMICASVGINLLHAKPYTPTSKGKIERFFETVRMRFLSVLDENSLSGIEELNHKFAKWLTEDYQRRSHSALGESPLDFFIKQANRIHHCQKPQLLEEHFLLRMKRKVHHDGTIRLDTFLYEANQEFAGKHLEVRYDPSWLLDAAKPVLLYENDQQIGTAKQVNFYDNAHVKRRKKADNHSDSRQADPKPAAAGSSERLSTPARQTVCFSAIVDEGNTCLDKKEGSINV